MIFKKKGWLTLLFDDDHLLLLREVESNCPRPQNSDWGIMITDDDDDDDDVNRDADDDDTFLLRPAPWWSRRRTTTRLSSSTACKKKWGMDFTSFSRESSSTSRFPCLIHSSKNNLCDPDWVARSRDKSSLCGSFHRCNEDLAGFKTWLQFDYFCFIQTLTVHLHFASSLSPLSSQSKLQMQC